MKRWLRLLLVVQFLFFAGWGAMLLRSHRDVHVVWLATAPVDPRDLLSGHYVALRYEIESASAAKCEVREERRPATLYVRVEPSDRTVQTAKGDVPVWHATACREDIPDAAPGELWIEGRPAERDRISYGIERFYVAETSVLRSARSGTVVAKVAVNAAFQARVVDLVPIVDPKR